MFASPPIFRSSIIARVPSVSTICASVRLTWVGRRRLSGGGRQVGRAAVIAVTLAAYAPTVGHEFLMDDPTYIVENPAVTAGAPLAGYLFDRNLTASQYAREIFAVPGSPLDPRAEAPGFERLADEAILESERVAFLRHTEAVPAAPFDRNVIENHIAAAGEVERAAGRVAADTLPKTQKAHDDVVGAAERNRMPVNGDTVARGGLPGESEIAARRHVGQQPDDASHVEDDDAGAFADGVAERAGAGVAQVGHMIDFTAATAGRAGAETLGGGESQERWRGGWGRLGGESRRSERAHGQHEPAADPAERFVERLKHSPHGPVARDCPTAETASKAP